MGLDGSDVGEGDLDWDWDSGAGNEDGGGVSGAQDEITSQGKLRGMRGRVNSMLLDGRQERGGDKLRGTDAPARPQHLSSGPSLAPHDQELIRVALPNGSSAAPARDLADPADAPRASKQLQLAGGWEAHKEAVWALAFGGGCLFSGCHDGVIKQWNAAQGWTCTRAVQVHTEAVLALTWADGLLISGSGDCLAKVTRWDEKEDSSSRSLEGWQLIAELSSHSQRVGALAVVEGYIATGSADDTVRIWDRRHYECTATLKGHTDSVLVLAGFRTSSASSPTILCSGSCDSTICVWSTQSWQCMHRITGHNGSVLALAVLPPSPRCAVLQSVHVLTFAADKAL